MSENELQRIAELDDELFVAQVNHYIETHSLARAIALLRDLEVRTGSDYDEAMR